MPSTKHTILDRNGSLITVTVPARDAEPARGESGRADTFWRLTDALMARDFSPTEDSNEDWYEDGPIRVALTPEDGFELFVFTSARRRVLSWSVRFDAATPINVILAAIDAASKNGA